MGRGRRGRGVSAHPAPLCTWPGLFGRQNGARGIEARELGEAPILERGRGQDGSIARRHQTPKPWVNVSRRCGLPSLVKGFVNMHFLQSKQPCGLLIFKY